MILVLATGAAEAQPGWTQRAPMPVGRFDFPAATANGLIYTFGGVLTSGGATTAVWAYDPIANTWVSKNPMPAVETGAAALTVNGIIYLLGGMDAGGFPTGRVWAYDPRADGWVLISAMPTPRAHLTASVVSGVIYAIGGCTDNACGGLVPFNETYDTVTNTWTRKAPMPTARRDLASAAIGGTIYAIGGAFGPGGCPNPPIAPGTNEAYDTATDTWSFRPPMPTVRTQLAAGALNGRLYALGGFQDCFGNGGVDTVQSFDPVSLTWRTEPSMPTGRNSLATANAGGALYALGGSGPANEAFSIGPVRGYVTNDSNASVSVIDIATNSVIDTIPVGVHPEGVEITPDGQHVYVANFEAGTVTLINTVDDSTTTLPGFTGPWGIKIAPDGARVYVTNRSTSSQPGSVLVLDTSTNAVIRTISGLPAEPMQMALSGDGRRLFIVHNIANALSEVDTVGFATTVHALPGPAADVVVADDGHHLYWAGRADGLVHVVDTSSFAEVASIPVGFLPEGLALTPDGAFLYVVGNATANDGAVSVIDIATNTVTTNIPAGLGLGARWVAIAPDGSRAYVTSEVSGVVIVIDTGTHTPIQEIVPGGASPTIIAVGRVQAVTGAPAVTGRISGRVTAADGVTGVSGARVQAFPSSGGTAGDALTGADGSYAITGLAPGTYSVEATADTYVTTWYKNRAGGGDPVAVLAGRTTNNIDFTLAGNAGSISGRVTSDGVGVGGLFVNVSLPDGPFVTGATTNADGTYTTGRQLGAGAYIVSVVNDGFAGQYFNGATSFNAATPVPVNFGADTPNVNFALGAGAQISGTVTFGGSAAAGVQVQVFSSPNNVIAGATTDQNGFYSTGHTLPPGTYRLQARGRNVAPQFFANQPDFASGNDVNVPSGGSVVVNFAMTAGAVITGFVFDQFENPIAGATVDVFDGATGAFVDGGLTTDATGSYTTNGLPGGTYRVRARAVGFVSTFYVNATSLTGAAVVAAPAGAVVSDINFFLSTGTSIRGTVRDSAGNPLAFAVVDVFDAGNAFIDGVSTTGDGSYTTAALRPGSYKLQAHAVGYANQTYNGRRSVSAGDLVVVAAGGDTTGIDFALALGGGITGTITSTTGGSIEGAVVDLLDPTNGAFVTGGFPTDANGVYNTGFVLAGQYAVKARVPAPRSFSDTFYATGVDLTTAQIVTAGAGTTVANINIALPPGGVISGMVTDASTGLPIANANVVAFRVAGNQFFGQFSVFTDANGSFAVRGLRDGGWLLRASAPGFTLGFCCVDPTSDFPKLATDTSSATPISISNANTVDGLQLALTPGGGGITGTLRRADTNATLPNIFVNVNGVNPRDFWAGFVNSASTNANGTFSIGGLPDGSYVVNVSGGALPPGVSVGFYPGPAAASFSSAVPVSVFSGGVSVANFSIPAAGSRSISGRVLDTNGSAPRATTVQVIQPLTNGFVRSSPLNGNGTYTVGQLPPGRYLVRALSETGYETEMYDGQHSVTAGATVDVTTGNQGGINFTLPAEAPGIITGRAVRRDTGAPVLGANILVRTFFDSSAAVFSSVSRTDGTFVARGLAPGFYKMRIQAEGFLTTHYTSSLQTALTFTEGSWIQVTSGAVTPNVNVVLDPVDELSPNGGFLSGRVLTPPVPPGTSPTPVPEAVVQIRDAVTGATVVNLITAADGTYATGSALLPGNYQLGVFALRYANQWAFGQPSQASANTVTVNALETSLVPDITLSPVQGSISGQVFQSDGVTPLADAGVVVFDVATGGFVRGSTVTDTNGKFRVPGLAPGSYVAQGRSLGYARRFSNGAVTVADAAVTPIIVAADADTPNVNLALTKSSTIKGNVSYFGNQTGVVRLELFNGPDRVYAMTVTGTAFPRQYDFAQPAPDTQGIVPGTYILRAFLDSDGNGGLGTTEASVSIGSIVVAEGATVTLDLVLVDPGAPAANADLLVTNTAVPAGIVASGKALSYTLTVGNNGPQTATSVTLTDALPAGLTFLDIRFDIGICNVGVTSVVTCIVGALAPGTNVTVTIDTMVNAASGVIVNTATVTGNVNDPNPDNNSATTNTAVASATISGRVNATTFAGGISGATVEVLSSDGTVVTSTTTNSDGFYTTPALTQNNYLVRARADGFGTQYWQNASSQAAATAIAVGAVNVTGIDFLLSPVATIIGTVTRGDTGGPAVTATIDIFYANGVYVTTVLTDANGRYRAELGAGGGFKARARLNGLESTFFNGQPNLNAANVIPVTTDRPFTADITLPPGAGGISGRVLDAATGGPVSAQIAISTSGGAFVDSYFTDGAGNFSGTTLRPGIYRAQVIPVPPYARLFFNGKLAFNAANVITVTSGGVVGGINFAVSPAGSLSGRVTRVDTGAGVGGAIVDVFETTVNAFVQTVNADGNGAFSVVGLAPGSYKVRARSPGLTDTFYLNAVDVFAATVAIVNAAADTPNINIAMAVGGTIQGTVLDRVTHAPILNAFVFVFRPNANPFSAVTGVRTDATGHYTLSGLRDGVWVARVECLVANGCATEVDYIVSYWSGDADNPATDSGMANGIVIAGGNTITADINPATGAGRIQGRITRSDNGQPVPAGAVVQAFWGQFARGQFVVQTSTDANGNYTLSGLAPGPYVIFVAGNRAAGFANGYFPTGATNAGSAVPVVVAAGQTVTGKDFTTFAGVLHSISGVVTDTQGRPVDSVNVSAADPLTNFGIRAVNVNGDGSYVIDALPAGNYVARLQPNSGFEFKVFDGQHLPVGGRVLTLGGDASDPTGVNFTLGTGGTIIGRAVESGTGRPIAGVQMNLRNFFDNTTVNTVATQRDGTYIFRSVPAGTYKVRGMEPNHVTAWHTANGTGGLTIDDADFFTVAAGQTLSNIDITMDPGGATVTGRVFFDNFQNGPAMPVVNGVVQVRDAVTGFAVANIITRADGSFELPGLASGDYKFRIFSARSANEWFQNATSRETAMVVHLLAPARLTLPDVFVSDQFGTFSGRVVASDGVTPVPDAGVVIYDLAGNLVSGAGVTDRDGRYSLLFRSGLRLNNSSYLAQVRALGYAWNYYNGNAAVGVGSPNLAGAAPIEVFLGDLAGVDFRVTRSADLSGSVAYPNGKHTGTLVVELYTDDALTNLAYRQSFPAPTFPHAFSFANPAPDIRGLVPGTYFARAFLDLSQDGEFETGEPSGTAGPFVVSEGGTTSGATITMADSSAVVNLRPVAIPQTILTSQNSTVNIVLSGTDVETVPANLTFTHSATTAGGTLSGFGRFLTYRPPSGFTGTDTFTFTVRDRGNPDGCAFNELNPCTGTQGAMTSDPATVTITVAPSMTNSFASSVELVLSPSTGVSGPQALGDIEIDEVTNGSLSTIGRVTLSLPPGLTFAAKPTASTKLSNGLQLELGGGLLNGASDFSFAVTQSSTSGPGKVIVTGIVVQVAAGLTDSSPVKVAIGGTNPGVTPAQVQNGTIVTEAAGPVVAKLTPGRVARGAQNRLLTLLGVNFNAGATVSAGPDVTITSLNASPTQIVLSVSATPVAALGLRDVTLTNPASNLTPAKSATVPGALEIAPPPTLISTDRGPSNPVKRNVPTQRVNITGSGFQAPTTSPANLIVEFFDASGTLIDTAGLVTDEVSFVDDSHITATLKTVDPSAPLTPARAIRVTNPDGGVADSRAIPAAQVSLADPTPADIVGLAPPSKQPSTPPPTVPTLTSLTPSSAVLGRTITIAGSGFSGTLGSNSVSFAGPNGTRVAVAPATAITAQLTVAVPATAVDGAVTVSVNGQVSSNSLNFTVTSPKLGAVIPSFGAQGGIVPLQLTGSKFVAGATVSFAPATGITISQLPAVSNGGSVITLAVSLAANAPVGFVDVTVTNPVDANGNVGMVTLTGGFEIRRPAVAQITLPAFPDTTQYLPTVGTVRVTLDSTGKCTAKSITPVGVQLTVAAARNAPPLPATLRLVIQSSTMPGTATNEDCELGPTAAPDFSIAAGTDLTTPPAGQPETVTLAPGAVSGVLWSYDWGGSVRISAQDASTGTELGTLTLPIDTDNDGLPNSWEISVGTNPGAADEDGNGIVDGNDKFARDGLKNSEKFRGIYTQGPLPGNSGAMGGFMRLNPRQRHYFVRASGFGNDPLIQATPGTCGVDPDTGTAIADPTLSAVNPCPLFDVGTAFNEQGIRVVNVTSSFAPGQGLPRQSMMTPANALLDMVTLYYDAVNCFGAESCDLTTKTGIRQAQFATMGFSSFGTPSAYGQARLFKRAVDSYFAHRPYQHRTNDPTRVVVGADGTPMLAPITLVADHNDNGLADSGETTIAGLLAGDTYITTTGVNFDLATLDVNNDGCVELPQVGDPTTLTPCNPASTLGTSPQAPKQQVVRHVGTHEIGHAAGVSLHTTDTTDLMYQYSINWTRDSHFSSTSGGLLNIHNKGLQ